MDKEYFARKFVNVFPNIYDTFQAHLASYGEILEHVFFGEVIDHPLSVLLKENKDNVLIRKYIDFIEEMYSCGDDAVRNVIVVTILEYLGDDEIVLKNAYTYFSEELIVQSKLVESFLGRRDVKISYRQGKVIANW